MVDGKVPKLSITVWDFFCSMIVEIISKFVILQ